jgi:hypothetical protein
MQGNAGETTELKEVEVATGLLAIAGIAAGALIADSSAATVAGSTTAVGGAYLGVKIGTDQTKKAIQAQREEAAKGQIYAAHMNKEHALKAVPLAKEAAEAVRTLG